MDLGPDHAVRESIEEIDKAGRRARDFVQQILAFARPEAEQRRHTDLGALAQETVKLLRAAVPANIELNVDSDADTPAVLADATQMHQLLVNLCTNAWQAIDGNSGRIVVGLSSAILDARAAASMPGLRPGKYAHLSVSDSGVGIDAPTRERLFEPFFSTKPVGEGTGLGLAVVHGIVHAHQGAIAVQSEPGKGTTFHIYIPALPASGEPTERGLDPTPGRGRHVLFLDDNPELVHAMERTLPRQGYRVSGYTAAEEALAAVRAAPQDYDLVVTDYRLPRVSGLEVAREIAGVRSDLPVVVISGYVDENLRRAARDVGVREVLHKLHTTEELFEEIDRLTGNALAH